MNTNNVTAIAVSPDSPLSTDLETKLKQFFQLGLEAGCPRDQLHHFTHAGIILQERQLAASAAARLCDQPGGPAAIGYGGARGGGKTHWLFAQLGADDCQRVPGLNCLLLRKAAKANLQNFEALRQRLFARLPHEFTSSRGKLVFPNGSRIILGHYKTESEIDSYLGLEYDVIAIEEATQLTRRKYEDIATCCRTSKPGWRPRIYSTTNPGGIGHQWYLDKFITPHQAGCETDTRFIPARIEDNAFVNDDYKKTLTTLTGWQYQAWYDGDWNLAAGQYFSNFHPAVHLLREDFKPPSDAKWFASFDYGFTHFTAVLLGCEDVTGNIYVMDEHSERLWIPKRHALAIKAMLARHNVFSCKDHLRETLLARFPEFCNERNFFWNQYQNRLLRRFVAGADVFRKESDGHSVSDQYRELGLTFQPADTSRESGWSAVANRLGDSPVGIPPTLFIHPRCRKLIACLPTLQHDPDRPGDILKSNVNEEGLGGDDLADALRYLVATRPNEIYMRKLSGF